MKKSTKNLVVLAGLVTLGVVLVKKYGGGATAAPIVVVPTGVPTGPTTAAVVAGMSDYVAVGGFSYDGALRRYS